MTSLTHLQSFLEMHNYHKKHCERPNLQRGHYPFVTISRETGAGGHALAEAVIKQLKKSQVNEGEDWRVFDQEVCRMVVEDPTVKVSLERMLSEEYHSQIEDMFQELICGESSQDAVIKKIFKIFHMLAHFGKVILVGRAGHLVTRDLPYGIHIRLIAPEDKRAVRMRQLLKLDEKHARELIRQQDRSRQRLVKTYFNHDIENPLDYDVTWNTGGISVDLIAENVVSLIQHRMKAVL